MTLAIQNRIQGTLAVGAMLVGSDSAGLLGGTGTSAAKHDISTSTGRVFSNYITGAATSGELYGRYHRLYATGAGTLDVTAGRDFMTVSAAIGTAMGAHNSLSFGASAGSVSGLGLGQRCTMHVPDRALAAGGTYAALQGEIYCDGNSADISPTTQHSILRLIVDGGNATAQNLVKNLLSVVVTAGTDGTGNMVYTHTHSEGQATGSLRILVNGAVKYLKFWDAE